ncbi:hypothetical protein C1H46_007133 [Malus baccata]|uniref:Formamidase n=1 Tax=Malus baccata TaxID=106549 RepID=A0A540N9H9_MALBA|nr:hypothetical protein C1H46_007133 [Malus baccata]
MVDFSGGGITKEYTAEDIFRSLHCTDGIPAQPGDLLVVEICNLGPLPGYEWGFTATFDRENGGCFLTDHFPSATKAIWSKSQGDGEISLSGAIEMSGFLELKYKFHISSLNVTISKPGALCEIIRGGMKEYLTPMGPTPLHVNPIFETGLIEPRFSEWLVFEGISVDESGKQHYPDATVAYKRAVLNAIDYLSKFGYSKEQVFDLSPYHVDDSPQTHNHKHTPRHRKTCLPKYIIVVFHTDMAYVIYQSYLLLSCCPCEGRISGIVDSPNAVATIAIPTSIFDQVTISGKASYRFILP